MQKVSTFTDTISGSDIKILSRRSTFFQLNVDCSLLSAVAVVPDVCSLKTYAYVVVVCSDIV